MASSVSAPFCFRAFRPGPRFSFVGSNLRPMVLGNIKTGDGKRAERERQTADGLQRAVTPSEPRLSSPLAPRGLAKPPLHAEPRALGPTPQVPLHTPQSKSASHSLSPDFVQTRPKPRLTWKRQAQSSTCCSARRSDATPRKRPAQAHCAPRGPASSGLRVR